MRMGLRQINPSGDAAAGTYNDFGSPSGTPRKIVKWTTRDWATWKNNFFHSAQLFWDGKFWIDNRRGAFAVRQRTDIFIPNAFCRFKLIGSDAATGFHHHVIDVLRLAPDESWFGSHSTLYDSHDTAPVQKAIDSKGKPIMQRAHVHEVGHLLGLGHVAIGQAGCPATGDTNISACYGVTDADKYSVMGDGMQRHAIHGTAWRDVFDDFAKIESKSPIYVPPPAKVRPSLPVLKRIFPRTTAEFDAGA